MEQSWQPKEVTWEQLTKRLGECRRTAESFAEYKAMSRVDKGKIKDVGGFVGGALNGKQRKACNVENRSLVTLDIDYGQKDTVGIIQDMLGDSAWCLYSTHSHSSETPRYRLIVPLSRPVSADEYIPIARRIAETVGIDLFDDSSYQPERLMYWPSAGRDAEFVFEEGKGAPADVDYLLGTYTDWRDVMEWPLSKRQMRLSVGHGKKQEDPTAKPGIIGAFCRTYSISEAIATFLPDVYSQAGNNRYTFVGGSTEAGAVVYDDKWLYSHHGTDPCCEREVNAFDLVRIHKFGSEDAESDPDTPVNRLPSFRAMEAFAREDRKVNGTLVRERMSSIDEDFSDIGAVVDDGQKDAWKELLRLNKKGLEATPANYSLLLRNDEGLRDAVRYDSFKGRSVLQRDLPWRKMGDDKSWTNADDVNLIGYVSRCYGGTPITKTVLLDEWDAIISQNCYHPVRDYLSGLKWDGKPRLDTILADYLGASDDELTRAMTRKHMTAAVARIYEPGVKYDYILTLIGNEGLGKSTLIRSLGGEWFDDSFSTSNIGDKEAMEHLRGHWLIEMGELKDYKKSTVESFKAFISKQDDSFRPAYGRKTEHYARQCVFFATTNERSFLKGDTGNRRFWAVECGVDVPKLDVFKIPPEERDQIWAEAVVRYREGETLYLPSELEKEARERQSDYNEISADARIGTIAYCLKRRLPANWWSLSRAQRRTYYKELEEVAEEEPHIIRTDVCVMEAQEEFLGQPYDRYKSKEIGQIFKLLGLEPLGTIRTQDKEYGVQKRYRVPEHIENY